MAIPAPDAGRYPLETDLLGHDGSDGMCRIAIPAKERRYGLIESTANNSTSNSWNSRYPWVIVLRWCNCRFGFFLINSEFFVSFCLASLTV